MFFVPRTIGKVGGNRHFLALCGSGEIVIEIIDILFRAHGIGVYTVTAFNGSAHLRIARRVAVQHEICGRFVRYVFERLFVNGIVTISAVGYHAFGVIIGIAVFAAATGEYQNGSRSNQNAFGQFFHKIFSPYQRFRYYNETKGAFVPRKEKIFLFFFRSDKKCICLSCFYWGKSRLKNTSGHIFARKRRKPIRR